MLHVVIGRAQGHPLLGLQRWCEVDAYLVAAIDEPLSMIARAPQSPRAIYLPAPQLDGFMLLASLQHNVYEPESYGEGILRQSTLSTVLEDVLEGVRSIVASIISQSIRQDGLEEARHYSGG